MGARSRRGGDGHRARRRPRKLWFPCGHVESEPAVLRRFRGTDRVAWVGCRRCNMIVIVFADGEAGATTPGVAAGEGERR